MTYNEKKSLYESIMNDVAKTVKRLINELKIGTINNVFRKKYGGDFRSDFYGGPFDNEKYDLYASQKGELTVVLKNPIFGMNIVNFLILLGNKNIEWDFTMKLSYDKRFSFKKNYSSNSTFFVSVDMYRDGSIDTEYMDLDYEEMTEENYKYLVDSIKINKSLSIFSEIDAKNISNKLKSELNIDIYYRKFLYKTNEKLNTNTENSSKYNMTYNEKKSLYESIMKEVAKTVKRKINEDNSALESAPIKARVDDFIKALRISDTSTVHVSLSLIDYLRRIMLKGGNEDFISDISHMLQLYNAGDKTIKTDFAKFVKDKY